MKNQKGFMPIIIIIVVLLGFVGVYYFKNNQSKSSITTNSTTTPNPTFEPDLNWVTYDNPKRKFMFKYPKDWKVWSDDGNFNMVIGPAEVVSTLPKSTDENKVIYLMMSGPGQTNLTTSVIEKGGKLKVSESKFKINGLDAVTRLMTKVSDNSFSELETEIIIPNSQHNAVFTIRNKQLENQFDQILSTFKFTN